jgi:hypothetical protein
MAESPRRLVPIAGEIPYAPPSHGRAFGSAVQEQ